MDWRIPEMKPVVLEPWVVPDATARGQPDSIKPAAKNEKASFHKLDKNSSQGQKEKGTGRRSDRAKEPNEQLECHPPEAKGSLRFQVYDKTGDMVVKVINCDAHETTRNTSSESSLQPDDSTETHRGVVFAGKA